MPRYSSPSTSSEDDTSTAEAGAVSTTTTADMCRSMVRKGVTVQRCTGCGYTSDRRGNVSRHYRRIHVQLKKRRECSLCDEVFETKWQFYEHCNQYHPKMRQSWYTTTHIYKLQRRKTKSKLKSVKRSARRVESKEEIELPRVTQSTRKLRSHKRCLDASNDSTSCSSVEVGCISKNNTPFIGTCFPSTTVESTSAESFSTSCSSVEVGCINENDTPFIGTCSPSTTVESTSQEPYSTSCSSVEVGCISENSTFNSSSQSFDSNRSPSYANNEKAAPKIAIEISHLPIKKRIIVLAHINNSVEEPKINRNDKNNNKNLMSYRDVDLAVMDKAQREYLKDTDFDDLDAMLQLCYMKKNM